MEDDEVMLPGVLEAAQQRFLPVGAARYGDLGLMVQEEPEQVIDVLKVIVEGLTVDLAVFYDLLDGNVVQKLFCQQVFQRHRQRQFGAWSQGPHLPVRISYRAGFISTPIIIAQGRDRLQSRSKCGIIPFKCADGRRIGA